MIKPRRLSLAGHAGHVEKQMDATVNWKHNPFGSGYLKMDLYLINYEDVTGFTLLRIKSSYMGFVNSVVYLQDPWKQASWVTSSWSSRTPSHAIFFLFICLESAVFIGLHVALTCWSLNLFLRPGVPYSSSRFNSPVQNKCKLALVSRNNHLFRFMECFHMDSDFLRLPEDVSQSSASVEIITLN
jgi:hypothetical protein